MMIIIIKTNKKQKDEMRRKNVFMFFPWQTLVTYSYLKFLLLSTYVKKYRIIDSIVNRF